MATKVETNKNLAEAGFASIIVSVVLILIMSLITIGFAFIMRREQRQALDRQLSTQAYYAAETGVNDAVKAIDGGFNVSKTQCGPFPLASLFPLSLLAKSTELSPGSGVSYSCLLIDPSPLTLEYGSVDTTESTLIPIHGVDPATGLPVTINTLTISWQDEKGGTNFTPSLDTSAAFPKAGSWTANTGVLRAALTDTNGPLTRTGLTDNTFTAFFYPNNDATAGEKGLTSFLTGSSTAAHASQGPIIDGKCNKNNTPKYCNIDITGLNGSSYFLRLKSVYANSAVTIAATNNILGKVHLKDAQSLVDSTGKAQDILRRIQVRVPSRNGYAYPEFTIDSADSICKRLTIFPGQTTEPLTDMPGIPACNP